MEHLEGIADADRLLGRRFPLPSAPLPLARWIDVRAVYGGVEVEWNLDDSRPQAPGRLALFAGLQDPGSQLGAEATQSSTDEGWTVRTDALAEAQESLRPVLEVSWRAGELHLRVTAQGPWELDEILAIARSVTV